MTDIATLGLAVDSRQVVSAKKALDDLTASAKPAAAAAAAVEKSTAGAGKGAAALAAGTGLARHEMINLSRQLQDVGVSLVSGQSPFMVLAQQGAQIADIFGSSKSGSVGGAIKQVASGVASFLTPMRVLGLGVAAVGAAAYVMNAAWNNFTLKLDDTARSANTTTRELSKLQAAASFKGITGDDFSKGIVNFAKGVYDAQNNMGGLAEMFRANNVHARTFDDALEKAADLIKNASSDQQRLVLLQQMGLPATMEWVRLLSGGAEGLKKAKAAAADFAADDNMIRRAREFDESWNRAWTNFGLNARSAFQTAMETGRGLFDRLEKLATQAGNASIWNSFLPSNHAEIARGMGITPLSNFDPRGQSLLTGAAGLKRSDYEPTNAPAKATVDPAALQRSLSLQQQQLALYGQTATAAEAVRQVELQVQTARLSGVAIDQKRVEVLKQLAAEQTIGVTAIKAGTDAANIDAATVGMSVENATRYAAAQNALNEARRAGRELTPDNIAQIQREAAALGQAAGQADLLRFSYTSLVQGPMQTFVSALSAGSNAWDAFKKAGASALSSIASKLADMAAQNLWSSAFGGSSGSGFLSSIFGMGGGVNANGSIAGAIGPTSVGGAPLVGAFANGTNSAPGGWSIVGEKGPELINVPRGSQILPNGVMPGGGGSQPVHVTVGVSVDNNGNLQAYVKDVSQQAAADGVNSFATSPAFIDHVAKGYRTARTQRKV